MILIIRLGIKKICISLRRQGALVLNKCGCGGMADAMALGAIGETPGGSSPPARTNVNLLIH